MSENIFNLLQYTISKNQHRKLGNLLSSMAIKLDKAVDSNGKTLLFFAAEQNAYKTIPVIIKHGVSFDIAYDRMALHVACQKGNEESVLELLKHDVPVNEIDTNDMTPLMHAIRCVNTSSKVAIVRVLIEKGADMHLKRHGGESALECAKRLADQSPYQYMRSHYEQSVIDAAINGASEDVVAEIQF